MAKIILIDGVEYIQESDGSKPYKYIKPQTKDPIQLFKDSMYAKIAAKGVSTNDTAEILLKILDQIILGR